MNNRRILLATSAILLMLGTAAPSGALDLGLGGGDGISVGGGAADSTVDAVIGGGDNLATIGGGTGNGVDENGLVSIGGGSGPLVDVNRTPGSTTGAVNLGGFGTGGLIGTVPGGATVDDLFN